MQCMQAFMFIIIFAMIIYASVSPVVIRSKLDPTLLMYALVDAELAIGVGRYCRLGGGAKDIIAREFLRPRPLWVKTRPFLHDRGYCTMQPRVSR